MGATEDMLERIRSLALKHGLTLDQSEFDLALAKRRSNFPMLLADLFPQCAVGHLLEQGKAPQNYYPELFFGYVATTQGEFEPQELDFDSDDGWASMLIRFEFLGADREIRVADIDDSDWFTPSFVAALNQFACEHLNGRWVDFYDDCDWCTSLYVPVAAMAEFVALRSTLEDSRRKP